MASHSQSLIQIRMSSIACFIWLCGKNARAIIFHIYVRNPHDVDMDFTPGHENHMQANFLFPRARARAREKYTGCLIMTLLILFLK